MGGPLVTSVPGVIAVMALLVSGSLYLSKFKGFKSFGPALTAILLGMLVSNIGITPFEHPVYDFASGNLINLSIVVLLFSTDLKGIRDMGVQPLLAMALACVSVVLISIVFGVFFAPRISEGWKLAGMFVGTYTGGSSNLNAIGASLEVSSEMMAAANAADYVAYTPFILLMMYCGSNLRRMDWFTKLWPYRLEDSELTLEGGSNYLKAKEWGISDIAWLVALGFSIVAVSSMIASKIAPPGWGGTYRLLIMTTVSIAAAQVKQVKELKGTLDLGMYLSFFYLSYIGLTVNLKEFVNSALMVGAFCFVIIFLSLAVHTVLSRMFKIKYQYVLLSMQAAVGSSVSATVLAAASGWESLVGVAVVLGLIGNAVGNYLGVFVAHSLRVMLGL